MNLYDNDRGEYKQVFCIVSSLMRMRKNNNNNNSYDGWHAVGNGACKPLDPRSWRPVGEEDL